MRSSIYRVLIFFYFSFSCILILSAQKKMPLNKPFRMGNMEITYLSDDYKFYKRKFFFPNGALKAVQYVKNNELEGKSISYYKSGSLLGFQSFVKGNKVGEAKTFYENGNLKAIAFYKTTDDEQRSYLKEYTNDGVLTHHSILFDRIEIHKRYNEKNGKLKTLSALVNHKLTTPSLKFDAITGQIICITWFYNRNLVYTKDEYYNLLEKDRSNGPIIYTALKLINNELIKMGLKERF